MLSAKERAADTAPKNNRQIGSYRSGLLTSNKNLKQEIGELLWSLQFPLSKELSQIGWMLFEQSLRRYVDLRLIPQSLPERPGSTKSGKIGIG